MNILNEIHIYFFLFYPTPTAAHAKVFLFWLNGLNEIRISLIWFGNDSTYAVRIGFRIDLVRFFVGRVLEKFWSNRSIQTMAGDNG